MEIENSEASVFAPIVAYQFLKAAKQLLVESPLGSGYAMIKTIVPVADARSHLMEVRLDMSTFDWPIGLAFTAQVANGPSEMLLVVPRDALVLRRDGARTPVYFVLMKILKASLQKKLPLLLGLVWGDLYRLLVKILIRP